jgi:hypothetical protein
MIEYRTAGLSDADAVALLHTRSWRESYRGVFLDAFLDREFPDGASLMARAKLQSAVSDAAEAFGRGSEA